MPRKAMSLCPPNTAALSIEMDYGQRSVGGGESVTTATALLLLLLLLLLCRWSCQLGIETVRGVSVVESGRGVSIRFGVVRGGEASHMKNFLWVLFVSRRCRCRPQLGDPCLSNRFKNHAKGEWEHYWQMMKIIIIWIIGRWTLMTITESDDHADLGFVWCQWSCSPVIHLILVIVLIKFWTNRSLICGFCFRIWNPRKNQRKNLWCPMPFPDYCEHRNLLGRTV
jgi:hypothetical protein